MKNPQKKFCKNTLFFRLKKTNPADGSKSCQVKRKGWGRRAFLAESNGLNASHRYPLVIFMGFAPFFSGGCVIFLSTRHMGAL